MMKPIFHLMVFSLNVFTICYDQAYIDVPCPSKDIENLPFKARHLFLTIWCLVIQTLYFAVAFLTDIFESGTTEKGKVPLIRAFKDTIFSIAFPLASYVAPVFWTIYHVDRELIFPEYMDAIVPNWVNHVLHTTILIFILIELVTSSRTYPSRAVGISILTFMNVAYTVLLVSIFVKFDVWMYPLFGVLSWTLRILFFVSSTVFGWFVYLMCEKINAFVWSNRIVVHMKSKGKYD